METEELQQIKWHRKQLLEDIQVSAHSSTRTHTCTRSCLHTHMYPCRRTLKTHTHRYSHMLAPQTPAWSRGRPDSRHIKPRPQPPRNGEEQNSQRTPPTPLALLGLDSRREPREWGREGQQWIKPLLCYRARQGVYTPHHIVGPTLTRVASVSSHPMWISASSP